MFSDPSPDSNANSPIYMALRRYLNDDGQLFEILENANAVNTQPLRITTCGLLKAGKSTLLNVLTDHLEVELFATGATRTTVQNQSLMHNDIILVDTPGLDATDGDDMEAWKSIKMADVFLFVHNPGTGELHLDEVEFLKKLAVQAGGERSKLNERLVIILTWLESNEEIVAIGEAIHHQIKNVLGIEPRQFKVSCTSYQKGKLKNKQKLVEFSGIPALRSHLFDNLVKMRKTATALRNDRIRACSQQLIDATDAAIAEREKRIISLHESIKTSRQIFASDAETFINTLRRKIDAYESNY